MRILPSAAVALVMTLGLAAISGDAKMPIEMPGGDAFETTQNQEIESANAEALRELAEDPALAQSDAAATDAAPPDPAPREVVTVDKNLSGVPGDEKFEAALNASIERQNEEVNSELARDPTGLGKLR